MHQPHATAFEIESTYGRGAQGPLTRVRGFYLLATIVYAGILILLEVTSYRKSRFSITLLVGIDVVAKGVETQPEEEFLKAIDCTFFQGHLVGRPAPISRWL